MEFENAFFDTNDYEITRKKIGEGTFGRILLVKQISTGKMFAAKIIHSNCTTSGTDQKHLIREIVLQHKLNHPAIVKLIGINFHSFDDPSKLEPTILTEYIPNGSLSKIIDKERMCLTDENWNATKKYICLLGIADAMRYLHKKGILHRDLKPENILIDEDYYPRICDFGLSRCFSDSSTMSMTGKVGTPLYMAPELFNDEDTYSSAIDVYAFSMIAYEIVSGIHPFSENSKSISLSNLMRAILEKQRPKFVNGITDKMQDLLSRCWDDDPKQRPSFEKIFEELSTSFDYLEEDVDEDEIYNYIDMLKYNIEEEEQENKEKQENKEIPKELESNQENQDKKSIQNERKIYLEMFKKLLPKQSNVEDNILHLACKSGNIDLVKYIISLNKIDISSNNVFA